MISIQYILYEASYVTLFCLTILYFLLLYFCLGYVFKKGCQILNKKRLIQKVVHKEVDKSQIRYEILHSLKSIFIFGFSILPIIYGIRSGWIVTERNTVLNIVIGLVVLNIWNEIHFYIIHRIMHIPFLMKHVHFVHHKTTVPTLTSVFSFHWVEALLLSTLPLSIALWYNFSPLSIGLYPITSILFNFAGHSNYRLRLGKSNLWKILGNQHYWHHNKGKKNYGFVTSFLDVIFKK